MLRLRPALAVAPVALALTLSLLGAPAHAAPTTFSGRVVDTAGRALPGLLVTVLALRPGVTPTVDGQATTDAAGRFTVASGTHSGRRIVRVCQARGSLCRRPVDATLLKAYVGPAGSTSSLLLHTDGFVDGSDDARDLGDVAMQRPGVISGTAPLAGRVRLTTTAPVSPDAVPETLASTRVEGGRFRFAGLAPGLYRVTAGWTTRTVRVRAGSTTTASLAKRASTISGTVRVGGRPLRHAWLRVVPVDRAANADAGQTVRADVRGRYRIARLPAGAYAVTLGRSVGRIHDQPIVTRRVHVRGESSRVRLDFAVRPRGTGVAGSVHVKPLPGWSRLVNVHLSRGSTDLGVVRLDGRGRYRLRGLPAGTYRLTAERRGDDYSRVRTDTTTVTVRRGTVTRVRHLMPREGRATLTVRGPAGSELRLTGQSGLVELEDVVRRGASSAAFPRLAPGLYTLRTRSEERLTGSLAIRVGTADQTVEARLGPVGGTTRGHLVTAAGTAAPLWDEGRIGLLTCTGASGCATAVDWSGAHGYELRRLAAGRWDFQPRAWHRGELQPYFPVVIDLVTARPGVTTEQDLRIAVRGG